MEKDEMKRILFELNEYSIREKQGYLLESSQKLIDYVYENYDLSQVSSIKIKPDELGELGIVHNGHGIEIKLNIDDKDMDDGSGYGKPYFSNREEDYSIAYVDSVDRVLLRHELIHCLDYNKYWVRERKEGKGSTKNKGNSKNVCFEEHPFRCQLWVFTYMYDIIERFSWLAQIEDELRRDRPSKVLNAYKVCYQTFNAGMTKRRPTCMAELKDNFPAICIYNEACLSTSDGLYFMPRVLEDTEITKANFFKDLTDEQFEEMRATLYGYLKRNWQMIENVALQMQNS